MESIDPFLKDPEALHMYHKRLDIVREVATRERIYREAEDRATRQENRLAQEKKRIAQEKKRFAEAQKRRVQAEERIAQEKKRFAEAQKRRVQAEKELKLLKQELDRYKSALKEQDEDQ